MEYSEGRSGPVFVLADAMSGRPQLTNCNCDVGKEKPARGYRDRRSQRPGSTEQLLPGATPPSSKTPHQFRHESWGAPLPLGSRRKRRLVPLNVQLHLHLLSTQRRDIQVTTRQTCSETRERGGCGGSFRGIIELTSIDVRGLWQATGGNRKRLFSFLEDEPSGAPAFCSGR